MHPMVSCVRQIDGFYKLIFSFRTLLKPDLQTFSDDSIQDSIAGFFAYESGWWMQALKNESMKVTAIDILLPPFGEYFDLEKRLKETLFNENIVLTVYTGITFDPFKKDVDKYVSFIRHYLRELSKSNTGNN